MNTPCTFCDRVLTNPDREILESTPLSAVFRDGFPSAEGHTLVIPRRHVGRILEMTDEEYDDLFRLVRKHLRLLGELAPDAYTIGVNDGPAAGQTVEHVHVHLIPRRYGDTPDPRGGIRAVIEKNAKYWES